MKKSSTPTPQQPRLPPPKAASSENLPSSSKKPGLKSRARHVRPRRRCDERDLEPFSDGFPSRTKVKVAEASQDNATTGTPTDAAARNASTGANEFSCPDLISEGRWKRFVDPVGELKDPNMYRVNAADAGTSVVLMAIKPLPRQKLVMRRPYFELAEFAATYDQKEKDMIKLYSNVAEKPVLNIQTAYKGMYGVHVTYGCRKNLILRRIKFISDPIVSRKTGKVQAIKIVYIDYNFQSVIDSSSTVWFLDKDFAILPPRVCAIEMEGMYHYHNVSEFRQLIQHGSREFVLDGLLTAEVGSKGRVVLFSRRFPKKEYPYGINGVIVSSLVESSSRNAILPPIGVFKTGMFIVHANPEGKLHLQYRSALGNHFLRVYGASHEMAKDMQGKVTHSVSKVEIYMAPLSDYDSSVTYYRAKVMKQNDRETVHIKFIDYGDECDVKIKSLVRASEVHPLLSVFPAMCFEVQLSNIWSLEVNKFLKKYTSTVKDIECAVTVVEEATKDDVAEVILWSGDGTTCINKKLAESDPGRAVNEFFDYENHIPPKIEGETPASKTESETEIESDTSDQGNS